MKKYEKPVVMINEELAEGVYAASGCFQVKAEMDQVPTVGMDYYVVKYYDILHTATNNHHSSEQVLTLYFNQAVTYKFASDGEYISGNGTTALKIKYTKHYNPGPESNGGASVQVYSDAGLAVTGVTLECNQIMNDNGECPGC